MRNRFEIDKADAASAERREVSQTAFKQWLAKHPEVPDCDAVENLFREYADWDDALTEADFEFAYGNLRGNITLQKVSPPPTDEQVKAALIEKICSLIASSNQGRDGKFDSYNLITERTKMNFWSIPELAARLEDVIRKQSMAAKPISELQTIVRSARKYVGFPQLGRTVVAPGTVHAVNLDAAYLRGLDSWDLKKLCRLYGVEQVNARLAGKE
jgi:hypothetical protein